MKKKKISTTPIKTSNNRVTYIGLEGGEMGQYKDKTQTKHAATMNPEIRNIRIKSNPKGSNIYFIQRITLLRLDLPPILFIISAWLPSANTLLYTKVVFLTNEETTVSNVMLSDRTVATEIQLQSNYNSIIIEQLHENTYDIDIEFY